MTTPIASLLPHAPPMLLLDDLIDHGDDFTVAASVIRPDHPFFDAGEGAVPAHVGIELMAQTCGAFSGLRARAAGHPPVLGFLLGTRNFLCRVRWFREGARLIIRSTVSYLDGEMGVFDCGIDQAGTGIASARLTVYQPADQGRLLPMNNRVLG